MIKNNIGALKMDDKSFFMYILYCLGATFLVLDYSHSLRLLGILIGGILLGMMIGVLHTILFEYRRL